MTAVASPRSPLPVGPSNAVVASERALTEDGRDRLAPTPVPRLLIVVAGTVTMTTNDCVFTLPQDRGLWLPAGQGCELLCRAQARLRMVRFDRPVVAMPTTSRMFDLSPLIHALTEEIASGDGESCGGPDRAGALAQLLMRELGALPDRPIRVTLPRDPRLRRVCEAIVARPSDDRCIDEWSREAGMARRTFTQSFRDQTGMGFAGWRRQVRLAEAAERIAAGQPIGRVAYDMGYESSSAFTAMFRRTLGAPPRAWLRHN